MEPMFAGKKGLVLGIANDYSIAWHIAKNLLDGGATIGFSHLPTSRMTSARRTATVWRSSSKVTSAANS